jgi:hypothetical protein
MFLLAKKRVLYVPVDIWKEYIRRVVEKIRSRVFELQRGRISTYDQMLMRMFLLGNMVIFWSTCLEYYHHLRIYIRDFGGCGNRRRNCMEMTMTWTSSS